MAQLKSRKKLNMTTVTVLAAVCVVVCTVILTSMTFGWFSSSATAKSNTISAGRFNATIQVTKSPTTATTDSDIDTVADFGDADIVPFADTENVTLTDGTLSLEPNCTYDITITANGSVKGYVSLKVDGVSLLHTPKMSNEIVSTDTTITIHFTIAATTGGSIAFDCGWQTPADGATLAAEHEEYSFNENTIESAQTISAYYLDMAYLGTDDVQLQAPYIIDPVSGFLYELATGNYINALTGEFVEPTTGFAYDESGEYLVHTATQRLVYIADGVVYDLETGWATDVESGNLIYPATEREVYFAADGNLIDAATGWVTLPESGELIHGVSLRTVAFDIDGNLIDVETSWLVDIETGYLVHPISLNLVYINENLEVIDVITNTVVNSETGLPTTENGDSITENGELDEDSENIDGDDDEILDDNDQTNNPETDSDSTPVEIVYNTNPEFYNIPDTMGYQLVPGYVDDVVLGKTYTLFNTVDFSLIILSTASYDFIDAQTGYYTIPGSVYQIVPATGYLYNTTAGFYADPLTGYIVNPEIALGIITDQPTDGSDDNTDTTTPSDPVDTPNGEPSDGTTDDVTNAPDNAPDGQPETGEPDDTTNTPSDNSTDGTQPDNNVDEPNAESDDSADL